MSLTKLEALSAFSPGSMLWVIPNSTHSRWAEIIDWETGFQLSRTVQHQSFELDQKLKEIISACGINVSFEVTDPLSPLMVASQQYLPNTFTVEVIYDGNKENWIKKVTRIWANLNFPSVRVFLPKGFEFEDFKKYWSSQDISQEVTIVPDSAAPL